MNDDRLVWFLLVVGALVLVISAAGALGGCSMDHNLTVKIDLEDDCLLRFPECSESGYQCTDADGNRDTTCEVACVAARALLCTPEGPECLQRAGAEEHNVPVVCITRGEL